MAVGSRYCRLSELGSVRPRAGGHQGGTVARKVLAAWAPRSPQTVGSHPSLIPGVGHVWIFSSFLTTVLLWFPMFCVLCFLCRLRFLVKKWQEVDRKGAIVPGRAPRPGGPSGSPVKHTGNPYIQLVGPSVRQGGF